MVSNKSGPKSDISIFNESKKGFDPKQKFHGDKAYEGGESIKTPKKKPQNKELTIDISRKTKS
ncbi:hypothetical protein [Calothrix sp. CCY 0018]|uniref:hypothetical protein n=1 Tax=Calothrix sp. CCY 0018 TaxID=3103864 RepID=UPI0039C7031F